MSERLRPLPLRDLHVSAGARFAPFAGWEMPLQYSGIVQEHTAVRERAGIFDVSHMGRVEVHGPDAGTAIRSVTTADITRLRPGRARYSLYCTEDGGIADDVMVYCVAEERWLVVHNAANAAPDAERLRNAAGDAARDVGGETVMLAVQGPDAAEAIRSVLGIELDQVRRRGCLEVDWEGGPLFFGRTGYTGEDGGECVTDVERGARLWSAFVDAGVEPAGLGARDTLRLEAALALHGHDISPTTTPYEAGLGWAVHLDDGTEFTGRTALERIAAEEPTKLLTCVRLSERGVPREGYTVLRDGEPVGTLTSGAYSPTLRTGIGMAYLPRELTDPGTVLAIEIRGRATAAEVVERPFYQRPE